MRTLILPDGTYAVRLNAEQIDELHRYANCASCTRTHRVSGGVREAVNDAYVAMILATDPTEPNHAPA
jgi:hypothetical protein